MRVYFEVSFVGINPHHANASPLTRQDNFEISQISGGERGKGVYKGRYLMVRLKTASKQSQLNAILRHSVPQPESEVPLSMR
jgi:hypothetical protein